MKNSSHTITFTIPPESDDFELLESEITVTSPIAQSEIHGDGDYILTSWDLPDMAIGGVSCKNIYAYKWDDVRYYCLYAEGDFGKDENGEPIEFIDVRLKNVRFEKCLITH